MAGLGALIGRRDFLVRSGLVIAGAGTAGYLAAQELTGGPEAPEAQAGATDIRAEFALEPGYVHLTAFLLAPHPRPVREAIERHRRALDANPKVYLFERELELESRVLEAAAAYLGAAPEDIALTDSTTMGLGLAYGTLRLRPGQEVVTTAHDHYATHESLRLRAERTGASVRRIALYRDIAAVSVDEIVESVRRAIRRRTRALALTWVHSSTGLKLPIRAIADALATINADREERDRVLLCVDGVHGLGVEDVAVAELGCDVFCAGCHKWLFGPRGTGFVWASPQGWSELAAVIPTFDGRSYVAWIDGREPDGLPPAAAMTPGGFHSFEHRWALADAFQLHERIGRSRAAAHVHRLAGALKDGLAGIGGVNLVTPISADLSAGLVCFELRGREPREVVDLLQNEHRVIASVTPYATEYVRLGPSLVNTDADVADALRAVRALA
jgi:isopenicillin-N epimerase